MEKVTGHCSSEVSRNRVGVSPRPSLVVEESGAANVSTRLGRLSRSTRASVLPGERVTGSRAAQRGGSGRRQAADALGGPRPPAVLSRRSGRRAYDLGGFFLFLRLKGDGREGCGVRVRKPREQRQPGPQPEPAGGGRSRSAEAPPDGRPAMEGDTAQTQHPNTAAPLPTWGPLPPRGPWRPGSPAGPPPRPAVRSASGIHCDSLSGSCFAVRCSLPRPKISESEDTPSRFSPTPPCAADCAARRPAGWQRG